MNKGFGYGMEEHKITSVYHHCQ